MKTRIKVQGLLIFLSVVLLAFFHRYLLPQYSSRAQGVTIDIIGIILFLLGYFLRVCARGYKAELNPDGKTLVTKGPYALSRNPMYLGTLLIGLGIILLILEWYVSAVFLIIYLLIYIPQIKKEEKKLSELFGEEFAAYSKVIPRFFPRISSLMHQDRKIKIKPAWFKKEFFSFAASSLFIVAVKLWLLLRK